MEDTFKKVEELTDHVKEYVNNRISSVKLDLAEKSSRLLALLIAGAIALLVLSCFILFGSIALAYALAKWTGEFYWGFLIVAGLYLLVGIIVWFTKDRLLQLPIMNAMLKQLFKDEEDDDEV